MKLRLIINSPKRGDIAKELRRIADTIENVDRQNNGGCVMDGTDSTWEIVKN